LFDLFALAREWLKPILELKTAVMLLIEGVMFALILVALKRSRLKLQAVVDDLGKKLERRFEDVREVVDQPLTKAPDGADAASWERIRELWKKARMRIELMVEAISDRLEKRKYNSLSRYTYDGMVKELSKDGLLSGEAAESLSKMNQKFLALRPARAATPQEATEFAELYQRADKALPKLPDE
jgi:hypothetical protein